MRGTSLHTALLSLAFVLMPGMILRAQLRDSFLLPEVEIMAPRPQCFSTGTRTLLIDSVQLHELPFSNLSDLLFRHTPVSLRTVGPSMLSLPSFRGTSPEHTAILWNGIPLNSPVMGLTDLSLIPSGFIESAEIRLGGGSSLFGTSSLGATVNLMSPERAERGWQSQVQLGGGSFGARNVQLGVRGGTSRISGGVHGVWADAQNDYPYRNRFAAGSPTERMQHAASTQFAVMPWVSLHLRHDTRIHIAAWRQLQDREIPNPIFSRAGTGIQRDSVSRIMMSGETRMGKGKTEWKSSVQDERIHYQDSLASVDSRTRSLTFWNELSWRTPLLSRMMLHTGFTSMNSLADVSEYGDRKTDHRLGIFTGIQAFPAKGWVLHLLLRKGFSPAGNIPLTGSTGMVKETRRSGAYRMHLSRNYNLPVLNMRYWQPGGNPNLKPESSWVAEAGWRYETGKSNWRWGADAGLYAGWIRNWIQWQPGAGGIWSPVNVKEVMNRGTETETWLHLKHRTHLFQLHVRHQYTRSENLRALTEGNMATQGKQVIYVPLHQASAALTWKWNVLSVRYQHQFFSRRYTTADNSAALPSAHWAECIVTADFRVRRQTFSLNCRVQNIWNVPWESLPGRPMPGRSFLAGIEWKFKTSPPQSSTP